MQNADATARNRSHAATSVDLRAQFASAFAGRRVFVTGHTGFKGSWLCLWLHRLGAQVTGYSLNPPTNPNHYSIAGVADLLDRSYEADVRDLIALRQAISEAEPELIFHLAAETIVRRSYRLPREAFEVNVMGTVNVMECVRQLKRPCAIVAVTTDKCYENREQVWGYRECDPMGEHEPYGASKGAAELAIRSYRHTYFAPDFIHEHGVRLASARAGNVIGGGDFTQDALLVDVISALQAGHAVRLRNPQAIRPWQHVLPALSGYLQLAARLVSSDAARFCDGWNFGPLPGNELPVAGIVDRLIELWGRGSWVDASDPHQPPESCTLRLAIDKALWELGWRPHWDIHRALHETLRWYQAYFERPAGMGDFGRRQIEEFEAEFFAETPSTVSACIDLDRCAPAHAIH